MKEHHKKIISELKDRLGRTSSFAVPRLVKVVINVGVGKMRDKKDAVEAVEKSLSLIAGQKAMPRPARKAIASFKSREGMIVGYAATLRGRRMFDFLDRLVHFTIPRMRDFRGIPLRSIDQGGNLTIGIKEHIIFPEMIGEDVRTIFGLEVTVVTNAKNKEEAIMLFRALGFPLQKV